MESETLSERILILSKEISKNCGHPETVMKLAKDLAFLGIKACILETKAQLLDNILASEASTVARKE